MAKLTRAGVLSSLFRVGAGALFGLTADRADASPEPAADAVATVDMAQVYFAVGGQEELDQKMDALNNDWAARLEAISSARFLRQNDLQEYAGIVARMQPTPADQTRRQELETLARQNAQELNTLRDKKDSELTPQDRTRMNELLEEGRQMERSLPALQARFQAQADERQIELRHGQTVTLRRVVAEVAKEKSIAQVFDSSALAYAATDITQAVIERAKRDAKR